MIKPQKNDIVYSNQGFFLVKEHMFNSCKLDKCPFDDVQYGSRCSSFDESWLLVSLTRPGKFACKNQGWLKHYQVYIISSSKKEINEQQRTLQHTRN